MPSCAIVPIRLPESSRACFYDLGDHAYYLSAVSIPSVTQILTLTGAIDARWFNPEAAERGRAVHALCMQLDLPAGLNDQRIDPALGGYIEAYRAFKREARPRYDGIEQAYWHQVDRYGGRPDRSCRQLFGHRATLELKTGGEEAWHGLQLAGYERLRPRGARFACYLQANGAFKVRQYRRVEDHREFLRRLRDAWNAWPERAGRTALLVEK